MGATNRELKQSKDLVQTLLTIQDLSYNDWLHSKHQEYIQENQDVVMKSLLHYKGISEEKEDKNF
ncbi:MULTISPECIES: hypothetical protein [Bacillaceae]|uniref:Uncharacterized protein n=3 Tax=Bacillaceae TaxID=186817 RepID=A0A059NXV6_9BACI|nr:MULTISPECIES: hypothetical protein [Bacillaceae]NIK29998.1 hypothetical protein [Thalassobacillus devorans]RDY69097.1 hypothetical protein DXT76_16710 [Halobacillus trueperi]CDQ20324.1 hypothetical protein BN982_02653 [Halobacillus karajensis]CDQ23608.1 hypothetical protein BN983_01854 [Halobacillus karajensis]CDQ27087.1 hypothetical protein BN981_01336 [Halobacillus karajensis]